MKNLIKAAALTCAAIAATSTVATPAMAQVGGIATADPAQAIVNTNALRTAYQQVAQAYSAQATSAAQLSSEVETLSRQLDTNNDGQLSDEEVASARTSKPNVVQQIQSKEQQIATARQPIVAAQLYAVEQVLGQFRAAAQQVTIDKKISVILTPDSFLYAPPAIDVTPAITTALNTRVPSVATTVPAGWQPQRDSVQIHQQIAQLIMYSAAQARQQQQQQPTATQPQGR